MKNSKPNAIVFCEGAFNTPNGKTAHGLVRFTNRYTIVGVVDSRYAGRDAGSVLDGKTNGISIYASVAEAKSDAGRRDIEVTHCIIGLAPDGGRLNAAARADMAGAIELGLNIDSGLHDFLAEDSGLAAAAARHGVVIRDVRRSPDRDKLHFFTGDIEKVDAYKIAVLGTDSAVGKRTTAWKIVEGFAAAGYKAEMIGTGQTAWFQGARYSLMMDTLINDFLTGEIEHAVVSAWMEQQPDVIVIEGQGSLLNPAYPGGYEILAAARPDVIVLQHAPARREYDGFPGYRIHPLPKQIAAVELISGKPVVALTINHEDIEREEIPRICDVIERTTGLPTIDVLVQGPERLTDVLSSHMPRGSTESRVPSTD
jgi:uncharacterized NAD-dependent epimerase/dehydratase family protein